jgi:DNA polymerase-3 subunit alpha
VNIVTVKIAQDIAGFTLEEADTLRKAIGKKKADIMAQVKTQFIEGCKKVGIVSEEEAAEIFGWIQESQRYSFNFSHGVSYGAIGYWTAYVKAHFPIHFVTAWLYYAHEKMDSQEEVQQLVSDAKYFGIPVLPPSLTRIFNGDPGHFSMFKDSVYFGIGDIKKIGESHVKKVLSNVKEIENVVGKEIGEWEWSDFLIFFSDTVSQTVVNGLVAAGATDYMGGSRSEKIHEFNEWRKLTQKERDWIKKDTTGECKLVDSIRMLLIGGKLSKPRRSKIEDIVKSLTAPSFALEDDAYYIANHEQELLGIPLTCTKLDTCYNEIEPNTTCKEFLQGKNGNISIRVEIIGVGEYIIKQGKSKGQKMLFLKVEDDTASLESVVVFPNVLHENQSILINGGTVVLEGKRDSKQADSFIVENVIPI